jgi:hypothetical protein
VSSGFRTLAALVPAAVALALSLPPAVASADVTVANRNDSGPGSLRQAIADVAPGDVVHVPAGTPVPAGAIAHRPLGRYRLAVTPRANRLTGRTTTAAFRLVGR